jgi:hypothetical protein
MTSLAVFSGGVVDHAFGLQREGLMKDPTILERYEKLAGIG